MRRTTFLPTRPMTKDDVLRAVRDSYRFAAELDSDAVAGLDMTVETTVEDWRTACDLVDTPELGWALNVWFHVHFDDLD